MRDLEGFDAFYAVAYRRVVGQVFALLGDLQEAEDVTQEAFAKASLHWKRIADTTSRRHGSGGSPSTRPTTAPAGPGAG